MAYKYFFKTLDAQADRLLQSADVSPELKNVESYSHHCVQPPAKSLAVSPVVRDMTLQLVSREQKLGHVRALIFLT